MNTLYRKRLNGTDLDYFDVKEAVDSIESGAYDKLPLASRILAENLVRRCPTEDLNSSLTQIIQRRIDKDFPWYPSRVICHDILGLTAFIDLAGLREAIAKEGGEPSKVNPIVPTQLIVDHSLAVEYAGFDKDAFKKNREVEERRNADRFDFINWTKLAFDNVDVIPPGNGIMHQINLERMSPVIQSVDGVASPDTLVGTDSHTPHVNALSVLAVGVGGLEAENVMLGNPSYMRLPSSVGVEIVGKRVSGITATDIALAMTKFLRESSVMSAYIEFYGEGVSCLSLGDRATISNMTPEYGASVAMFAIDAKTIEYLKLTGRAKEHIELVENYAKTVGLWSGSLKNAQYDRELEFDLSKVTRLLSGPSQPHRVTPISKLKDMGISKKNFQINQDRMIDGAVVIAAITSCTNTSNPKNVIAAALLAKKANKLGLKRKPWVKTSLAPGSKTAELYLKDANLLSELETLGFGIVGFACTTCNGMSGALDSKIEQEIVAKELQTTAVLSGNRNFDGRIHPHVKKAFLASPPLVVAYAIAGNINLDIENGLLSLSKDGKEIRLKDIWPSDEEIDEIASRCVKPEHFNEVYEPMFAKQERDTSDTSPLYSWNSKSTYIRSPPYWDDEFMGKSALKNMRPLGMFGDNITTDHLSPSNAIMLDSAAGEYLAKMGLLREDFNSYATHRGDHLTAQRATLANPKLLNEMVIENEKVTQGSLARVEPDGKVMRMWEAIQTYLNKKQPLIIIAGVNYGQGSSRDWAAKGVRLAGVEVVIAKSIERIHRTNLVGMGVLPLEFKKGEDRNTYNLDGTETYEIFGEIAPRLTLLLVVIRKDGQRVEIPVTCRIDTSEELSIYSAGGILQRFAQDMLKKDS